MPDHFRFNEDILYWEYCTACKDEVDIEEELLCSLKDAEDDDEWLQNLIRDLRKALCIIDELKISGTYDDFRNNLRQQLRFQLLAEKPTLSSATKSRDPKVIEGVGNLTDGLRSSDLVERVEYQAFFDKFALGMRTPREIKELLVVLKKPKSRNQGGRPQLCPPWRDDVGVMEAMRLDVNSGMSIPKAASKHALNEGKLHDESRAKRFDRLYRQKMKLRN